MNNAFRATWKRWIWVSGLLAIMLSQSGCLVVGGYSSRGGWFIWPGSLGLVVLFVLLYLLLGRRG